MKQSSITKLFLNKNKNQNQNQNQNLQKTDTQTILNVECEDDLKKSCFNDSISTYHELRKIHLKNNIFVPLHLISNVIMHHFPNNSAIVHDYTATTKLIRIKIHDLLIPNKIVNWNYNREPDYVRIPAISKNIYETRCNPIKTLFYINYNFKNDNFEIIDGSHRFKALEMLLSLRNNNGKIIDSRLKNTDGNESAEWFDDTDINWILNEYILIYCCFQSTQNELIQLRDNINLSQPMEIIPSSTQINDEKYQIINRIADDYQLRFKKNFSDSNDDSYLKSNGMTNRNKFIKLLSNLYDKYNIDINRVGILQQHLQIANDNIHAKLDSGKLKCSQKSKKRCDESGCYLFMYKNDVLEDFI